MLRQGKLPKVLSSSKQSNLHRTTPTRRLRQFGFHQQVLMQLLCNHLPRGKRFRQTQANIGRGKADDAACCSVNTLSSACLTGAVLFQSMCQSVGNMNTSFIKIAIYWCTQYPESTEIKQIIQLKAVLDAELNM